MTRRTTGFESLPDGTTLNASNHGGDTFTQVAMTGGTIVGDTTRAAHGARSLRIAHGSGGINSAIWTETGSGRVALRFYTYHTAIHTTGSIFGWLGIADGRVIDLQYRPTGKVRVTDAAGGSGIYTTTSNLPLNQWVRHELDITVGTTTSNGRVRYAMYPADSTTPVDAVFDSSAANTGTANLTTARIGAYNTSTDTTPYWVDDFAFDDAATGLIGPVSTSTANLVLGSAPYYVIDARSSSASGGTPTYSLSKVSGDTLTYTEPVEGLFYVTQGSAAVYRVTMTVGAATDTEDVSIPALATSTQAPNLLAPTGTTPGSTWA